MFPKLTIPVWCSVQSIFTAQKRTLSFKIHCLSIWSPLFSAGLGDKRKSRMIKFSRRETVNNFSRSMYVFYLEWRQYYREGQWREKNNVYKSNFHFPTLISYPNFLCGYGKSLLLLGFSIHWSELYPLLPGEKRVVLHSSLSPTNTKSLGKSPKQLGWIQFGWKSRCGLTRLMKQLQ